MKITVVGGNSGTGAQVIQIARDAGHQLTCLSRSGMPTPIQGVRDVTGDALDGEVVRTAVEDADVVIVTVGGSSGTNRHRTAVTQSVISAMQDVGVRRLIVHSSLGVGDSMSLMPAPARLFTRTVLRSALADHADQEAAVAASGLDWTVVRPGGLTNGPATGSYVAQETADGLAMKGRISRADVASYIVGILDDPTTFRRALAMGTP